MNLSKKEVSSEPRALKRKLHEVPKNKKEGWQIPFLIIINENKIPLATMLSFIKHKNQQGMLSDLDLRENLSETQKFSPGKNLFYLAADIRDANQRVSVSNYTEVRKRLKNSEKSLLNVRESLMLAVYHPEVMEISPVVLLTGQVKNCPTPIPLLSINNRAPEPYPSLYYLIQFSFGEAYTCSRRITADN